MRSTARQTGDRANGHSLDQGTQAYKRLRQLIVRGMLAPGSRLIEAEVSQRLGISRTPVRSAFQRLIQEGYVTDPGTGRQCRPFVAPLTQDDALELFCIVGEIEGLAAWGAAKRKDREELVANLNLINEKMRAETEGASPSSDRIFQLDNRFHRCYVQAGGGPRLIALHDAIKPQTERYTRLYVSALVNRMDISRQEHQKTVDAIDSGDADLAQESVRTNWRNAARRLCDVIELAGEIGSW